MKLDEAAAEHLNDLTVELVLGVRAQYLAGGANPLKHWDRMTDRIRAATRTQTSVEAWVTRLLRDLQLSAPSSSTSSAVEALVLATRQHGGARVWLALLDREYAYVMARARRLAEERRAERLAQPEQGAKIPQEIAS